jgi:prepilin-type N-terminal cleavage/methylation domain-containing protein
VNISALLMKSIKKAFTLIELMIVMAVIAILMGLILPSFKGMKEEAQHSRVLGDLRTLQTALESYFIHHDNQYPPSGPNWQEALLNATPKILQKLLEDPFSSSKKPYTYVVNGSFYAVWSVGFKNDGGITQVDPQTGKVTKTGTPLFVSNGENQQS